MRGPEPYPWLRSWLATPGYWISPGCSGSLGLGCCPQVHDDPCGSPGIARCYNSEDWGAVKAWRASDWSTAGSDLAHSDSSCKKREKTKGSFTGITSIFAFPWQSTVSQELSTSSTSLGLLTLGLTLPSLSNPSTHPLPDYDPAAQDNFPSFCLANEIPLLMSSKTPTACREGTILDYHSCLVFTSSYSDRGRPYSGLTLAFATQ